ncbi:MAG TPA: hypothetical protein ENN84_02335 [Candidatus Marinimicrobia bacterium]|nr:hypothetical protein [Candidatus Neomarinimicrobiota bacterium]
MSDKRSQHRITIGIILIAVGGLLFFNQMNLFRFGKIIGTWWPMILIAIGFLQLKSGNRGSAAILLIVGIFFQLNQLDIVGWNIWNLIWPLLIVFAGIYLLKGNGSVENKMIKANEDGDTIDVLALFSGSTSNVNSQVFNGGQITAIFGGADVDLSQAKSKLPEINLTVTALFGGADLRIGDDWRVQVQGTPIFGGIDDKRRSELNRSEEKPLLKINATVIFGGIEIK